MRLTFFALAVFGMASTVDGAVLVSQAPVSGGGVTRWSQLWQDPGPNGNDLNGDSVCWQGFVLPTPATIDHMEWWGNGASELGFQIEFWRQDPGTIAYQPLGVFYYGGDHTVLPESPGFIREIPITSPGPGGLTHYAVDLSTPVALAANDAANPRWFVSVIGLTHQAYYTWNWAQSLDATMGTFQFVRGDGHTFRNLGDARALVLATAPGPGDYNGDGVVDGADVLAWQWEVGSVGPGLAADGNGDNQVDDVDLGIWRANLPPPAAAGVSAAIPEPDGAAILAAAAWAFARWRRRDHG